MKLPPLERYLHFYSEGDRGNHGGMIWIDGSDMSHKYHEPMFNGMPATRYGKSHLANKRASGILLHITCLPSPYGVGDLGPWAYRFVELLRTAKQSVWQILPINPITPDRGNSPYNSLSAFAGNIWLISPDIMVEEGLLRKEDIEPIPKFTVSRVDYPKVITYKRKLFDKAYERFKKLHLYRSEYEAFCEQNVWWVEDYATFVALKEYFTGKSWNEWPCEIRDREPTALQRVRQRLRDRVEREKFLQFLFFRQWFALKSYCNKNEIRIFGDIPIYVSYDSVDVWTTPEIFKLGNDKRPLYVAGVPPDYFSPTGQLWGNPVYRWDVLKQTGYEWWIRRVEHNLRLFDMVRIDHFRGLVGYWEVPAGEKTAVRGCWVKAGADDFFATLMERFDSLPIVAEDLGVITEDVRKIMERFKIPGMRVLLFAFGDDFPHGLYLPHNHIRRCVVYTGTHDTNTIRGWFEHEATPEAKERLLRYIGRRVSVNEIHWELIRLAMLSVAELVIIPLQDVLGLGKEARMNRPATAKGNWEWRVLDDQLTATEWVEKLSEFTETYDRA